MSSGKPSSKDPAAIDEIVRRAYEEILNEALPDRLVTLLETLKEGEFPDDSPSSDGVP